MTPALQQAMAYMNETRDLTPDEVGRIIREATMKAPHEMTRAELARYTYGPDWRSTSYKQSRCAETVPDGGRSVTFSQCSRKPGHGPGGLYCKQHAKRYSTVTTHDDPAIMQSGSSASWGIEPKDEATP